MASPQQEEAEEECGLELPEEIVERVLSFLSVPDLCRLRLVCKSWKEILSKPSFHDLHQRNPNKKADAFLFVTRDLDCDGWSVVDPMFRRTVSFLDLETQRWHSIDAGESSLNEEDFETQLSAMDDGLICELSTLRGSDDDLALTIADPVARTRITLPAPPEIFCLGTYLPILLPTVDTPARSFKVFLVNNPRDFGTLILTRVHVLDASRNEWRALRNPPKEFEEAIAGSAVMLNKVLYIIFRDLQRRQFALLRYDFHRDTWTELRRMCFPRKLRHPQLVTRGSRLFMNAWLDGTTLTTLSSFEVLEINASCQTVAQFTIAQLRDFFDEQDPEFDIAYAVPCMALNGLCSSVVLMSSLSGKLISCELKSGAVSALPTNPLIQSCCREQNFPAYDIFRATNMSLSLRNLLAQQAMCTCDVKLSLHNT